MKERGTLLSKALVFFELCFFKKTDERQKRMIDRPDQMIKTNMQIDYEDFFPLSSILHFYMAIRIDLIKNVTLDERNDVISIHNTVRINT